MHTAPTPEQGTSVTTAAVVDALEARRQRLDAHYALTCARYSESQIAAIKVLYEAAQRMLDTGGGSRCAKVLLGLYNGTRFPFDLTDLRCLDGNLYQAALAVIDMDARRTYCEVHELLNAIYADGRNVGAELETWAWRLRWGKRGKKEHLNFDYGPKWSGQGGVQ
jgi:hypothetical protein